MVMVAAEVAPLELGDVIGAETVRDLADQAFTVIAYAYHTYHTILRWEIGQYAAPQEDVFFGVKADFSR
jgi:hypothetical protein